MQELLLRGAASRAELAARAGMSRPTAGKIIDDLLAARVLEEPEPPSSHSDSPSQGSSRRMGRPGRLVSLESRQPRVILVQLGVLKTQLTATPLRLGHDVQWSHSFATPRSEATFLRKLQQVGAALAVKRPWVFAVSVPGLYDERQGRALLGPNLRWVEGLPLVAHIEDLWRIPGCGVQEIRALALGHKAHEKSKDDFLLVDADDGVGAAAFIGESLLEGSSSSSGELGHTVIANNDRLCGCGGIGCLETVLTRKGLLTSFAHWAKRPNVAWADLVAALAGQIAAPQWFAQASWSFAITVGGALNLLGLDKVVLTGLFAELPQHSVARVADDIGRASLAARFGRVKVTVAPRRRAEGLLRRAFDQLLIPTEDWRHPGIATRSF